MDTNAPKLPFSQGFVFDHMSQINFREWKQESAIRVKNSSVLYANYELLMNDFPQLRESELVKRLPHLADLSKKERTTTIQELLNKWLLKHTSFVSIGQSSQHYVNSRINVEASYTRAFRPNYYGRALIYSIQSNLLSLGADPLLGERVTDGGLIDVKGTGVPPGTMPQINDHANGLMGLDECIYEVLLEQLIHRIFKREKSIHRTLPIYGIIDLGFNAVRQKREYLKEEKRWEVELTEYRPAGLLLRRAHNRFPGYGDLPFYNTPNYDVITEIEMLFRKYGMTSANRSTKFTLIPKENSFELLHGMNPTRVREGKTRNHLRALAKKVEDEEGQAFDGINVQLTADFEMDPPRGTLVDFGHYNIQESFEKPMLLLARDRVVFWGEEIWPDDPRFVQPDPDIAVPYEQWGGEGEVLGITDVLVDENKLRALVLGLSTAYRNGDLSGSEIIQKLEEMIGFAQQKWDKIEGK